MKRKKAITSAWAAVLMLTAALTACTSENFNADGADGANDNTPLSIGTLAIGSSAIGGGQKANDTRLATASDDAWEDGDCIRVSATPKAATGSGGGTTPTALTATYIYKVSGSTAAWQQVDPGSNPGSNPAVDATGDTYPLYIEDIDPKGAFSIETYGGSTAYDATTDYADQSDPASGSSNPGSSGATPGARYRLNNHLLCTDATLHTADGAGFRRGQLTGTLRHQRVSLVLKVLVGTDNLPETSFRVRLSCADAYGTTAQDVTAWNAGSTPAGNASTDNPDGKAYHTFRAYLTTGNVPGAQEATATDGTAAITVPDHSLLGYLDYNLGLTSSQPGALPGPGSLPIYYSVAPSASGPPAQISAGTRLTITADFTDVHELAATATLAPWEETDLGDFGTEEQ